MSNIFIGNIYPENKITEIINNGSNLDNAAHNFQSAILDGFLNNGIDLDIVTDPIVSSFPKYKKIQIRKSYFVDDNNRKTYCIGFINLPIINLITKYLNISSYLNSIINKNNQTLVIVNNIHTPYLRSIKKLKKRNPNLIVLLIVPDLPEYMSAKRNIFYRILKNIDRLLIFDSLIHVDLFVLLSSLMTDKLPIDNRPWMVMEGIYDSKRLIQSRKVNKETYKTVLYSGGISKRYGLLDLLEAFHSIDSNDYRLWICGTGDAVIDVLRYQKIDSRIIYYGMLPIDEVIIYQKKATLLINPRNSRDEYTKYSFPSKTMEYMASGTPVLMSKLKCIPKEYEPYLYFIEDESIIGLKNKIIEICEKNMDELDNFGAKASNFIISNKNSIIQTRRIIDFITSNSNLSIK